MRKQRGRFEQAYHDKIWGDFRRSVIRMWLILFLGIPAFILWASIVTSIYLCWYYEL